MPHCVGCFVWCRLWIGKTGQAVLLKRFPVPGWRCGREAPPENRNLAPPCLRSDPFIPFTLPARRCGLSGGRVAAPGPARGVRGGARSLFGVWATPAPGRWGPSGQGSLLRRGLGSFCQVRNGCWPPLQRLRALPGGERGGGPGLLHSLWRRGAASPGLRPTPCSPRSGGQEHSGY